LNFWVVGILYHMSVLFFVNPVGDGGVGGCVGVGGVGGVGGGWGRGEAPRTAGRGAAPEKNARAVSVVESPPSLL